MQNSFPKKSFLISTTFMILSCLGFFFFLQVINNSNKELQTKEGEWQNEEQRRDGIKMLERSVKAIEGERAQLETHFAQSSDIVPFLDTIEGLAPKVSVKAEVTSVDVLSDSGGLLVGMNASGTFSNLYKFLTLLENSPYELEFISMDMHKETGVSVEGKNTTLPKWNVIFKIKLLSFMKN